MPSHPYSKTRIVVITVAALIFIPAVVVQVRLARAQSNSATESPRTSDDLIAQFRRVEVASVSDALTGMLAAIDQGSTDAVYVMVVEDGEDIAGMGGLMGTAMSARGYAGAVIDGGVRDVAYLRKIGFPVYATGIVPSTSVHHYRFGGGQIPVTCDGVTVNPGDIVTADSDGVVIVPRAKAQEVLTLAQQMDFKEHSMYAVIEQLKSIVDAVKKFGR